jgi:hypothetical protein
MCFAGQRAFYAVKMLRQMGYNAVLLSGGMRTHAMIVSSKL